eukprot:TRINITY_DN902_c0_g2_i4.p1 TRINITY_DN902_c0_g2~~TRINITY_DN902_c0_g2_i4.p1  ORF type:complete len:728 (-),score=114.21 TRINITY_DN902_c0_g2_i4:164-2347(-)
MTTTSRSRWDRQSTNHNNVHRNLQRGWPRCAGTVIQTLESSSLRRPGGPSRIELNDRDVRLHHNSDLRKTWDALVMFLLLWVALLCRSHACRYLLLVLPVVVAFAIETEWVLVVDAVLDGFFICDLVLNFFTSFENEQMVPGSCRWCSQPPQEVVTDLRQIAHHYLRTWFLVDFLSSIPLRWLPGMNTTSDAVRALKLLKLVKLMRIFRLGRMVSRLQERFQIKHATVMIVKFIVYIFVVAHWLGCIFIFATDLQDDPDAWTTTYLAKTLEGPLQGRNHVEKYISALYWSLTTMTTIGYGDIVPNTITERVFVIIAMMTGACFFAYGLTNVCSLIFNHNKYKARFEAATDELTEYIERRGFARILTQQLVRALWYVHNSSTVEDVGEAHSEMLAQFSPEIRRQAYRHLAKRTFCGLGNHPPPLLVPHERVLVQLFLVANPTVYPPDEIIWCTNRTTQEWQETDCVYYIVKGTVKVSGMAGPPCADPEDDWTGEIVETLGAGSSFGEKQVLLYGDYQVRQTRFEASEHTDVYTINRRTFHQILKQDPDYVDILVELIAERENDWISVDELPKLRMATGYSMTAPGEQEPAQPSPALDNKLRRRPDPLPEPKRPANRLAALPPGMPPSSKQKVDMNPLDDPNECVESITELIQQTQSRLDDLQTQLADAKANRVGEEQNANTSMGLGALSVASPKGRPRNKNGKKATERIQMVRRRSAPSGVVPMPCQQ